MKARKLYDKTKVRKINEASDSSTRFTNASNNSFINLKVITARYFKKNDTLGQCLNCDSDYMKYSVDGYCQNCIQRVEFIIREHPHVVKITKDQGGVQK